MWLGLSSVARRPKIHEDLSLSVILRLKPTIYLFCFIKHSKHAMTNQTLYKILKRNMLEQSLGFLTKIVIFYQI